MKAGKQVVRLLFLMFFIKNDKKTKKHQKIQKHRSPAKNPDKFFGRTTKVPPRLSFLYVRLGGGWGAWRLRAEAEGFWGVQGTASVKAFSYDTLVEL
jgi:hypothetical protein